MNAQPRKNSKNDFKNDFCNLMNNSWNYGKCEKTQRSQPRNNQGKNK